MDTEGTDLSVLEVFALQKVEFILSLRGLEFKMAGYCSNSFFVCLYMDQAVSAWSINTQKKNEVN